MIYKISIYRNAHEQKVKDLYAKEGINSISLYCTVSYCPILVGYWFCREVDPENQELTRRIESIKVFYGIEDVQE